MDLSETVSGALSFYHTSFFWNIRCQFISHQHCVQMESKVAQSFIFKVMFFISNCRTLFIWTYKVIYVIPYSHLQFEFFIIAVMPPLRRREGILLGTCQSVGLSVTFLINKWRPPWPTFLKFPHICHGQQRNPIEFGVTGSKIKCSKTISNCFMYQFPKMNFFFI